MIPHTSTYMHLSCLLRPTPPVPAPHPHSIRPTLTPPRSPCHSQPPLLAPPCPTLPLPTHSSSLHPPPPCASLPTPPRSTPQLLKTADLEPEGTGAEWEWIQVQPTLHPVSHSSLPATASSSGPDPGPRKSHATVASGPASLYLYGGTSGYGQHYNDLYLLDLDLDPGLATPTACWTLLHGPKDLGGPPACFSHTLSMAGPWLVLLGGYPTAHHDSLWLYHTAACQQAQHEPGPGAGWIRCAAPSACAVLCCAVCLLLSGL